MRHTPRSDQFFGLQPFELDRVKWCAALFLLVHVEYTLWFYRGNQWILVIFWLMPRNKVQQGLSWFSIDVHMMHEGKWLAI